MSGKTRTFLPRIVAGALPLLLVINVACTSSLPASAPDGPPAGPTGPPAGSPDPCQADSLELSTDSDLQAKIDSAGRGASLCFKPGTYRLHKSLAPKARQTLTFERGAVLSGARVATGWKKEGNHWVLDGQTQRFSVPSWMREQMCDNSPQACIYEDVYIDDEPLQHVTSLSQLGPGRVYLDKDADKIYIATDPQGHTMEVTVAGIAIASEADGVIIWGATIEKFAYNGINTTADRWTISNSEIRHIHLQGIGVYGGTGHLIQDSFVHHNGVIGMTVVEVDDFIVQRSEFAHNNYLHAGPVAGGYHEGSVKILQSHDVVFRDNYSHHNYADGLWFDTGNHNILIENNLLERNTRHGLQYETSFDATVRHNTIRNNGTVWAAQGAGILNSTSKNVEYYGNRITNNAIRSIVILWRDRGRDPKLGEHQSADLLFRDNVIVLHRNFQSWVGVYWDQDPQVFSANNRFEGNTYIAPIDSEREGERWWLWEGKDLTWAQWRAYGFDAEGSYLQKRHQEVLQR